LRREKPIFECTIVAWRFVVFLWMSTTMAIHTYGNDCLLF
jgi:hypothetical protein